VRVFLSPGPAALSPLEAPARETWLLDRTLGETMARDLAAVALEVVPVASLEEGEQRARQETEGAFVILDSVLCSPTVIRRFRRGVVQAVRGRTGPIVFVCALPKAIATDHLSHVEGLELRDAPAREEGDPSGATVWTVPFYFVRGAGSIAAAEPLVQPYRETLMRFPVPYGLLGRSGEVVIIGLSESYMCSVSHWVHVLRINTSAMFGWWVKRLRVGYVLGAVWLFWRFLLGFPWWGGRLFGAIRGVSWGARVHHTAVLELSIVKKGAMVGANANLKNSFVDEGAMIGEGAQIIGSVIGKGATVAPNSVVSMSVVYPGAMAAQVLMQGSVLGKCASAFTNSNFFDVNFARNVRVLHRGRLVDSGTQMLGVCVGPEARVSAGVWVASGREIPAGALLVKPPGEIASNIGNPTRGEAHVVVDGDVVPLRSRS
jgi:acetyltransferase-like isoleucine patch superfamily enzyme